MSSSDSVEQKLRTSEAQPKPIRTTESYRGPDPNRSSIGEAQSDLGDFNFWAQKQGEYWPLTSYKRRFFCCRRDKNTITYWASEELALKPNKQPTECARGEINIHRLLVVKQTELYVDIEDNTGRVFHLLLESEKDLQELKSTFNLDKDRNTIAVPAASVGQAKVGTAAATATQSPSTSVGTSNVAKYQIGQQVANIGGHKVGFILQIVPQTAGATTGPGIVHVGPVPLATGVKEYKDLLGKLLTEDGGVLPSDMPQLEQARQNYGINQQQHDQFLQDAKGGGEALKALEQLLRTGVPTQPSLYSSNPKELRGSTGSEGLFQSGEASPRQSERARAGSLSDRTRLSTSNFSRDDPAPAPAPGSDLAPRSSRESLAYTRLSTSNFTPEAGTLRTQSFDATGSGKPVAVLIASSNLTIDVQIPLGKKPGDQLIAAAPDGRQIQVVVPEGVIPGQSKMLVEFPAMPPAGYPEPAAVRISSNRCVFTIDTGSLGINAKVSTHPEYKMQFRFFTGTSDAEILAAGKLQPGMVLTRLNGHDLRGADYDSVITQLKVRPCELCFQGADAMVPTAQAAVALECDSESNSDSEEESTSMLRLSTGPSPRSSRITTIADLEDVQDSGTGGTGGVQPLTTETLDYGEEEGGGWIQTTGELSVELDGVKETPAAVITTGGQHRLSDEDLGEERDTFNASEPLSAGTDRESSNSNRLSAVCLSGDLVFEESSTSQGAEGQRQKTGDLIFGDAMLEGQGAGQSGDEDDGAFDGALGPRFSEGSDPKHGLTLEQQHAHEQDNHRDSLMDQEQIEALLTVGELVGVGGMADVYEGVYLGASCAIKILRTSDPQIKNISKGKLSRMKKADDKVRDNEDACCIQPRHSHYSFPPFSHHSTPCTHHPFPWPSIHRSWMPFETRSRPCETYGIRTS
jgi:hypothetical protein